MTYKQKPTDTTDTKVLLVIAGFDPSGGGGLLADGRCVAGMPIHMMAATTALTVQNSRHVLSLHPVDPKVVEKQIITCAEECAIDAIKCGMLFGPETVRAVARALRTIDPDRRIPLVLDPVLKSTTGASLSQDSLGEAILHSLLPHATLITPNLPEAEHLTKIAISDDDALMRSARKILNYSAKAVLITGGHARGAMVTDSLFLPDGSIKTYTAPRINRGRIRGTGCMLSSGIAARLALGQGLTDAVNNAHDALQQRLVQTSLHGKEALIL